MSIIIPSKNIFGIDNKKPYSNSIKSLSYRLNTISAVQEEGEVYNGILFQWNTDRELSQENNINAYYRGYYRFSAIRSTYENIIPIFQKTRETPIKIEQIIKKSLIISAKVTTSIGTISVSYSSTGGITPTSDPEITKTTEEYYSVYNIQKSQTYDNKTHGVKISEEGITIFENDNNITLKQALNPILPYDINLETSLGNLKPITAYLDNLSVENIMITNDSVSNGATYTAKYLKVSVTLEQIPRLSLTGIYSKLNITTSDSSETNRYGNEIISLPTSELIQSTNSLTPKTLYGNTVTAYENGKETAKILCSIADYYDNDGNIIISKDGSVGEMCFSHYDEVLPSIRDSSGFDVPMSLLPSGNAKTFSVLGSRIYYDGAIWQEISLQEKGSLSLGNGTSGLAYELSADKTYYICSGIGESTSTEINIASKFGLYPHKIPVTQIKRNAFLSQRQIKKVIIPDSIETIGYQAFYGCDNLTTVNIPNSVKRLDGSAFFNCEKLIEIVIPGSITTFGSNVFYKCTSLQSVIIKSGLTKIGDTAFQSCSSLTTIYIPKSVKNLGSSSLQGCTSLTDIYYEGSSSDWSNVIKGLNNSSIISNATIHYNYYENI